MPASATDIQGLVHALESGGATVWLRRGLIALAIIALGLFYMLHEFQGLATSQAMDQAQIGREFARGHGWETKFARPLAAGQLQRNGKNVAQRLWVDTYNAPLPPVIDAVALLPVLGDLHLTPQMLVSNGDRAIAAMSMLLFVASLAVLYFLARRLFDDRLALLSCGLVLVSDLLWQYTLSGLPQMLLLLLLNLTFYFLVRAMEAQEGDRSPNLWLSAAGIGFGLLALSHALTIWMFVPALIFCGMFFRRRVSTVLLLLVPFLILYLPWLARNYFICGNPLGVAIYSFFDQIGGSEATHMRHWAIDMSSFSPGYWRNKLAGNLVNQTGRIFQYFGWSAVALCFFPALLHPFRRAEAAAARWLVLVMWLGAVAGMAVYGMTEEQGVAANQFHLLFVPVMTAFGLAFLLVQWNRLGLNYRLARIGFVVLLFLICGFPMLVTLVFSSPKPAVHWPPYVPPYIAVIHEWMKPDEVTASDMPWAVAWYADRRAVWLPESVAAFSEMSDYEKLGAPINAIYLTPISGSQNTLHEITQGDYKDWAGIILRSANLQKFPLKWGTFLGLENECLFLSNYDRQKANPTTAP